MKHDAPTQQDIPTMASLSNDFERLEKGLKHLVPTISKNTVLARLEELKGSFAAAMQAQVGTPKVIVE